MNVVEITERTKYTRVPFLAFRIVICMVHTK